MQPQQISGYMKPIMTWLKWVSWKIKVSFKGLQTFETLEIILPGTWDGTSLPVLDIFSLWCFWAYLHNCVLIRYRQAADSLKVTHKHWPLSCSLISRPTQPRTFVLYSVGNTLGNTGSPKVSVRSALTSVWGSKIEIISPQEEKKRGGGEEMMYQQCEVSVQACFGFFPKEKWSSGKILEGSHGPGKCVQWWFC